MCRTVNLLLLLSALLSALSGAQGQARAASSPVAVARTAERAVERITQTAEPGRPAIAVDGGNGPATVLPTAWALVPAQPIYLSRRRE